MRQGLHAPYHKERRHERDSFPKLFHPDHPKKHRDTFSPCHQTGSLQDSRFSIKRGGPCATFAPQHRVGGHRCSSQPARSCGLRLRRQHQDSRPNSYPSRRGAVSLYRPPRWRLRIEEWRLRIKKWRLEQGLIQKDLAKLIGVDEMTIVNWEKGRTKPIKQNLEKLEKILGNFPSS